MANSKRRQHAAARGSTRMGAQQPQPVDPTMQPSSAGAPTIVVEQARPDTSAAEATARSLSAERVALRTRRLSVLLGIGVLLLLGGAALLFFRPFEADQPSSQALVTQTNSASAEEVSAAAALAPQPTAAPVIQPTAAPAVSQAGSVAAGPGITCGTIEGLPVYTNAVCVEQDTDQDDGQIKLENTYETRAVSNEIQRFYESAFLQHGWTLQEFTYDIAVGSRQVTISAEAEQGPGGVFTKIKLIEEGATTNGATTCSAIADLPVYPQATCVEFDRDHDDGVVTTNHTYTVGATPDDVRNFYADAVAQNSWTPHELSYDISHGLRHIQVSATSRPGVDGNITRIEVAEK